MEKRNLRKERIGIVTSNKMDKSHCGISRKTCKTPYVRKIRIAN